MTSVIQTVIESITEAASEASQTMTSEVRISARKAGWPSSVARSLSVDVVDTSFQISGDDNVADHEYGGPNRPPSPVLRRYTARAHEAEAKMIDKIEMSLMGKGIL